MRSGRSFGLTVRRKKYPHVKGVAGNIAASDTGLKYIKDFRKVRRGTARRSDSFQHCKSCRISRYAFHVYNKKNRAVSTGIKKLKAWVKQVEHVAGSTKLMVTVRRIKSMTAHACRSSEIALARLRLSALSCARQFTSSDIAPPSKRSSRSRISRAAPSSNTAS